jgi:hypothetical protein
MPCHTRRLTLRQIANDTSREHVARALQPLGRRWKTTSAWETKGGGAKKHTKDDTRREAGGDAEREDSPLRTSEEQTPTYTPSPPSHPEGRSLLEELFPDANSHVEPTPVTKTYPKLDLPSPEGNQRVSPNPLSKPKPKSNKERMVEAFMRKGEHTTALQLVNCSTELTEADFRRMIPRGQHIDTWFRDGEFTKVIPGRDPLSLERLPFYYLLFKSPESALAYQKNVSRLHKINGFHQSSDILSAIALPKGFLEDGEDISTAASSYYLVPANHELRLSTVMQPYNPMLRSLIENGGYKPIVPSVDAQGQRIYKVLLYIEGYEPSANDLWHIFARHARDHGITWPFRNDHISAITRLRDIVNLKTKLQATSTANPRASGSFAETNRVDFEDAAIRMHYSSGSDEDPQQMNQLIMNRVYNRWILEFEEEDAARRFATMWHRKVLPDPVKNSRNTAWRETEETRICNAEFLW